MFTIDNPTLTKAPLLTNSPLLTGEAPCPKCGKMHEIRYGKQKINGEWKEGYTLAFVKCGDNTYLVGVNNRYIGKRKLPVQPTIDEVCEDNIWQYRQNKPSRIVDDMEKYGIPRETGYKILLGRGVCKWLNVRRKLIKLKNAWKEDVNKTIEDIKIAKKGDNPIYLGRLRGRLETLQSCRKQIRELCKSDRWAMPDYDERGRREVDKLWGQDYFSASKEVI
jgi:hypothetical protein